MSDYSRSSICSGNPDEERATAFDTLFSDEPSTHDGHGQAYEGYGVDVERVAVVVVRPDQYVAGIYGLEDSDRVASFFDKFMLVSAEV